MDCGAPKPSRSFQIPEDKRAAIGGPCRNTLIGACGKRFVQCTASARHNVHPPMRLLSRGLSYERDARAIRRPVRVISRGV